MEVKRAALVLADISGYTKFMKYHAMAVLHAEQIVTDLLEAVIDTAAHPLSINKLQGDAAFFYATSEGDDTPVAQDVLKQVQAFFAAFQRKEEELISRPVCICDACQTVGKLRLKVILHFGDVAFKKIRQFEELAGESVILAHRLLKNSVQAKEYILMSEEFHKLSGGISGNPPDIRLEDCEGIGQVRVMVYYPGAEQPAAHGPAISSAPVPVEPPIAPMRVPFLQRLRQYIRVNRHAVMRMLRLKHGQSFTHLPD